jgi:hypothetical protein
MSYDNLLTDTCTIVRRTQGVFNESTGQYGSPTNTSIYSGVCRVAPLSGIARRVRVGEEAVIDRAQWVFLPFSATGVKPEDIVTITASEDPDVIGREMTVKDTAAESSPVTPQAARWLVCEDIQEGP